MATISHQRQRLGQTLRLPPWSLVLTLVNGAGLDSQGPQGDDSGAPLRCIRWRS
jgi:hypothetical protein